MQCCDRTIDFGKLLCEKFFLRAQRVPRAKCSHMALLRGARVIVKRIPGKLELQSAVRSEAKLPPHVPPVSNPGIQGFLQLRLPVSCSARYTFGLPIDICP